MKTEKYVANAADSIPVGGDASRLVNKSFSDCFKQARLSKTGGSDIKHKKYVGRISTVRRALTSNGEGILSHFDKIDECQVEMDHKSLNHLLVNNDDVAANKGKTK